jgi:CheY-like chemotaxis protein
LAPGIGSTFRITLPLPEIPDAAQNMQDATTSSDSAIAARNILLVEDDAIVAAVISGLLQTQGHCVTHVAHALAALVEVESAHYDVALIDLDLPGVDGLTLARMLRTREAQQGNERLVLIGISARCVGDEEALCLAAGMQAFLRKPVTAALLAATITHAQVRIGVSITEAACNPI